ncbi:MAG: TM0106 family RecB-like putative nuclease [Calothrix sp. C42_A2020_038]|nr:TM0106 family RecB-like putative nuclease [Calothrix sp. C42_A2020_038]
MLINAELLLQYQRCRRRPFLDIYGDHTQRSQPTDLLVKLQQDKIIHQKSILRNIEYIRPVYRPGDWRIGAIRTLELMQEGVDYIYQGVLVGNYADIEWRLQETNSLNQDVLNTELTPTLLVAGTDAHNDSASTLTLPLEDFSNYTAPQLFSPFVPNREYTLVSCPDLLIKQPGKSQFGDWTYIPTTIELGKRPKQEYQVLAAYHAELLRMVQQVEPATACLMLRSKETSYHVDLRRWTVQMQRVLSQCVQSLEAPTAPEVFISRQKCTLCHWYSDCYRVASASHHLSLLPGVTPVRFAQLQALNITTPESLATTNPVDLENLPGFDSYIASKLVTQARSISENRALLLPVETRKLEEDDIIDNSAYNISLSSLRPSQIAFLDIRINYPVELYFDIEAQPDLNLNYLLGVLVVDNVAQTERFYSFLAEKPEDELFVWQQFLNLVNQYPQAPIFHFCVYEFDTVKRLAKLYGTQNHVVLPILSRFVDVYEELIKSVTLPIESYALKAIAKWLGFEWRDSNASGAKCIYWYDQWLKTGNHTLLEIIQRYNEDDCRATHCVKDWLVKFLEEAKN